MYESARLKAAKVNGPFGPLTIADRLSPGTRRWSIRRKATVIAAVRGGLLSLEEACRRYALNVEQYVSWEYRIGCYGLAGLRTTRTQFYLINGERQRSLRRSSLAPITSEGLCSRWRHDPKNRLRTPLIQDTARALRRCQTRARI